MREIIFYTLLILAAIDVARAEDILDMSECDRSATSHLGDVKPFAYGFTLTDLEEIQFASDQDRIDKANWFKKMYPRLIKNADQYPAWVYFETLFNGSAKDDYIAEKVPKAMIEVRWVDSSKNEPRNKFYSSRSCMSRTYINRYVPLTPRKLVPGAQDLIVNAISTLSQNLIPRGENYWVNNLEDIAAISSYEDTDNYIVFVLTFDKYDPQFCRLHGILKSVNQVKNEREDISTRTYSSSQDEIATPINSLDQEDGNINCNVSAKHVSIVLKDLREKLQIDRTTEENRDLDEVKAKQQSMYDYVNKRRFTSPTSKKTGKSSGL